MIELEKHEAQRFILERNGLRTNESFSTILELAKRVHNIQIDTISVVARAQDLTIFNRMPNYQEKDVWNHLKEKKLLEYWSHSICLMPIEEYPYYLWKIEHNMEYMHSWWRQWEKKSKPIIERVYEHVKKNGATRSADFKPEEKKKSEGWWSWKDEKSALEILFLTGRLLISHRENFQRYYDLPERVIPSRVSTEKLPVEDLPYHLVNIVFSSLGIASNHELKHYTGRSYCRFLWNNKQKDIEIFLDDCINKEILLEVKINDIDKKHYMLAKDIQKLEKNRKLDFDNVPVKFLTPFDNVLRERDYPLRIWDFDYKIEAYTPVEKRKYGYFALPILDRNLFIGRSDMKVHRKDQKLELKTLFFEENFEFDDQFSYRFSNGLNLFKKFHQCEELVINHCSHPKILDEINERLSE